MHHVVLPGTKMRFQAPLISFDLAVTPHPGPQGSVLADAVTTRYDLQDWIKGRDLEMEQVLALESAKRRALVRR